MNIRTFVEALSKNDLIQFLAAYGGADDPFSTVLASFDDPKKERRACDVVWTLFGQVVPTASERHETFLNETANATRQVAALLDERQRLESESRNNLARKEDVHSEFDVFLSWSSTASHDLAVFLRGWIPKVVPSAKPWLSSVDIRKGVPWFEAVSYQLSQSHASIICVTPENIRAPWIYYEAGAIANTLVKSKRIIFPYLIGVSKTEISKSPLSQLQVTVANKADTLLMVKSLNNSLADPVDEESITKAFNSNWTQLSRKLTSVSRVFANGETEVGVIQDSVTRDGTTKLEKVTSHSSTTSSASPSITDDQDILVVLQGWLRSKRWAMGSPPIAFTDVDEELNLPAGSAVRLLEKAANKINWVAEVKGPTYISFLHAKIRR